ncbi:DUF484 family protein [Neisseria montereyensis]|uniref:DUF484 family protein n=1 Tax=Neisseria montereyensis TaxID=2973938 RepID=A0ABT2FBV9_9NEIS|nr:DUF484 family protein [Neisseria montereyensis]MCS4533704.1 DUF484 family protein [Neisseria montereyensis]
MNNLNPQNVLDFLKKHPDFLVEHAAELGVRLRDDKVRSFAQAKLAESQLKIEKMADQLTVMMSDAEANQNTMLRQFALDIGLLKVNTVAQLADVLYESLRQDFGLQLFKLVIVAEPKKAKVRIPEDMLGGKKVREDILAITKPILGTKISKEMKKLLPSTDMVAESYLQLPIVIGKQTGALLLAADSDVNRFAADLETDSVRYMADAIGAALSRIMGYR